MKIKLLRMQAGMTLEQLAQESGLTRSYLSKIERGLSTPSIHSALKLSNALGVSIDKLFGFEGQQQDVTIMHAKDRPQQPDGYLTMIAGVGDTRLMQAFIIRPGKVVTSRGRKHLMSQHEGEEFLYVLRGPLELSIGQRSDILQTGDSAQFDSALPHKLRAVDDTEAEALIVIAAYKTDKNTRS